MVSVEVLSCDANGSISYAATIKNVGDVASQLDNNQSTCSQMVSIQAYLRANNNGTTSGDDKPAGGTVISCNPVDLQPGESTVRTFSATIAGGIDPSVTPYLEIYLIPERITAFSDVNVDGNNSGFTSLPNKNTTGPDLIMDSVEVLACDETSISYSATIKNVGDEEALLNNNQSTCSQNVSIQAYLRVNNDGSTNGGDKPAGGTVISCGQIILQPGESIVKTFSATVSAGIDPSTTPYLEIYLIQARLTAFSDINIDANNSGFTSLPTKDSDCNQLYEVEGGIRIEDTSCEYDGSIRYTGQDFEGYMSGDWHSLTAGTTGPQGPQGATGAQGPVGPQGPPGVSGSQALYTSSGSLNNSSININNQNWTPVGPSITLVKVNNDSAIELEFAGTARATAINSGQGIRFELRINGNSPTHFSQGNLQHDNLREHITVKSVFTNLAAGTHTIRMYAQVPNSGTATGVLLDPGGWGARIIAKEY